MATIIYSTTVTFTDANANIQSFTFTSGTDSVSTAEPGTYQRQTFPTSTSSTNLPTALIGTLGMVALRNCDSTNTIFLFANVSDTDSLIQIGPGEVHWTRFAQTATPAVASSEGTPVLEFLLFGN
jgi:hypothetical protein